jgi:hypothetical protein
VRESVACMTCPELAALHHDFTYDFCSLSA